MYKGRRFLSNRKQVKALRSHPSTHAPFEFDNVSKIMQERQSEFIMNKQCCQLRSFHSIYELPNALFALVGMTGVVILETRLPFFFFLIILYILKRFKTLKLCCEFLITQKTLSHIETKSQVLQSFHPFMNSLRIVLHFVFFQWRNGTPIVQEMFLNTSERTLYLPVDAVNLSKVSLKLRHIEIQSCFVFSQVLSDFWHNENVPTIE